MMGSGSIGDAGDEFFEFVASCMSRAVTTLERVDVHLPNDWFEAPAGSPSERAALLFGAAVSAVDKVDNYLKLERRSQAKFALDLLAGATIVQRRMEAEQADPKPTLLVEFAMAHAWLRQLAARGPARPQKSASGRPTLERQDRKTIYRWLKLCVVDGKSESDAWDRILDDIPGANEHTRERLMARARQIIGEGAPRSNQRGPILGDRKKTLRSARFAIVEEQVASANSRGA